MLPGVTQILGVINKPALLGWAARMEREFCVETARRVFDDDTEMDGAQFEQRCLEQLGSTMAHRRKLRQAGDIGTEAHALIEWWIRERLTSVDVPLPLVSAPAQLAYCAFEQWAADVSLEPLLFEHLVESHYGYIGRVDLLARVSGVASVVDFKTGKAVYAEAHLQNAAYRQALEEAGHHSDAGVIVRLPKSLDDPGFEVVPCPPLEESLPVFLAAKTVWAWWHAEDQAYRRARGWR